MSPNEIDIITYSQLCAAFGNLEAADAAAGVLERNGWRYRMAYDDYISPRHYAATRLLPKGAEHD